MYAPLRPLKATTNLSLQLRITNATTGKVDFELDITKDHTVRFPLPSHLPDS